MPSLLCIDCQSEYPDNSLLYTCSNCNGLLDVVYPLDRFSAKELVGIWNERRSSNKELDRSGVWRYRELLPSADESFIVTMLEGNTPIWSAPLSAQYAGMKRLAFKHLGMNPTGSFKDLGMTTGMTQAMRMGAKSVACASTGNTSASMAAYAARAGIKSFVFIPSGQIALGKLSQALDYGASILQIEGNFDDAMRLVREVADVTPLYLLNSVNPFRLEGQKTVAFEIAQQRQWQLPDHIVVPGGNLGNSSAIAKGFHELLQLGIIEKIPRITIVQAENANPLYRTWRKDSRLTLERVTNASTLASAIKIGNPISWKKAIRALQWSNGDVEYVTEQEIADAKAIIGRDGIGCEPASAVTVAAIKKMVLAKTIHPEEDIIAILTGHVLKDPDYTVNYHRGTLEFVKPDGEVLHIKGQYQSRITTIPANRDAVLKALQ